MKTKAISVILGGLVLAAACFSTGVLGAAAAAQPLVYEAEGKLSGDEQISYVPDTPVEVDGDALAVKVFLKNAYWYSLPLSFSVTSGGREYTWDLGNSTLSGIEYTDADESDSSVATIQWDSNGKVCVPYLFYGEVILPFSELNGGAGADIALIEEISVTVTAAVNTDYASGDSWVADGISLYLFGADCITLNGESEIGDRTQIADFCGMSADDLTLTAAAGGEAEGALRSASDSDYAAFEGLLSQYNSSSETLGDMKIIEDFDTNDLLAEAAGAERAAQELEDIFYMSGQEADYGITEGGYSGTALAYNVDSTMYNPGGNAYAGLHFNFGKKDATDWSGANGVAVYVENTSDHLASFAIEIFQYNLDTGKLEQYNLNDSANRYKTLYAYNVETGEEFSYHTQTYMRVPANFKGWIRIPFSQYAAPAWSQSAAYGNEGVLDFDRFPVVKVSLTRLFNVNYDIELIIDDIALYYGDFSVGNLFDPSKTSIRDCIENGSVPA